MHISLLLLLLDIIIIITISTIVIAGLLWQILTELSALHSRATQDSGTQADLTRSGPITSLGEREE